MRKFLLLLTLSLASSACDDSTCTPSATAITVDAPDTPPFYFSINGDHRAPLCLVRGESYTFTFNNSNMHPFVFTRDADGEAGARDLELTALELPGYVEDGSCEAGPCADPEYTIFPGDETPDSFYYQCTAHIGLGASVTVIDGPDDGKK